MHPPKALQNHYVAIAFVLAVACVLTWFNKSWWANIASIVLAFILADIIMSFTFRTNKKGYNFLYFLIFILVSTILSGLLANYLINYIGSLDIWTFIVANAIIFFLVYVDYSLRAK